MENVIFFLHTLKCLGKSSYLNYIYSHGRHIMHCDRIWWKVVLVHLDFIVKQPDVLNICFDSYTFALGGWNTISTTYFLKKLFMLYLEFPLLSYAAEVFHMITRLSKRHSRLHFIDFFPPASKQPGNTSWLTAYSIPAMNIIKIW